MAGSRTRIDLPVDADPITYVWGQAVPGIGPAAAAYSAAVYERTTLPLREFEAARLRVAQLNGCQLCLSWRTDRAGETVDDEFPAAVEAWRTTAALSDRERLAAELAERYVLDHHGLDDEFWDRARARFSDPELVELAMCIGSWLAFGRLNRVFGIDTCALPQGAPAHRTEPAGPASR